MLTFAFLGGPVPPLNLALIRAKNISVIQPTLPNYISTRQELEYYANGVLGRVQDGRLKINTSRVYSWEEVAQAHKDLEERRSTGKLLLKLWTQLSWWLRLFLFKEYIDHVLYTSIWPFHEINIPGGLIKGKSATGLDLRNCMSSYSRPVGDGIWLNLLSVISIHESLAHRLQCGIVRNYQPLINLPYI